MNKWKVFACVAIVALISPAQSIKCYQCEYISSQSSSNSNQKNCDFGNFDESGIKTKEGFDFCFVEYFPDTVSGNLTNRNGENGDPSFLSDKSSDKTGYIFEICEEDLCNGAPPLITSFYTMGLVTALWVALGRNV